MNHRECLVTKFVCSECGQFLRLTYDIPEYPKYRVEGEPTGAAMVQQILAIQPCNCVTHTLEATERALNVLFKVKEGKRLKHDEAYLTKD